MKFLEKCKADATADLVYRACPMHLLEPMELIKDLEKGQVLEILTDYDGALEIFRLGAPNTGKNSWASVKMPATIAINSTLRRNPEEQP